MTQKAEKVANVAKAAIFSLAGLNYSSIVVDEYLMFDWQCSLMLSRFSTLEFSVGNRGDGNLRLIGLIGLGPASRVFTCSLLDRLLSSNNKNIKMPPYDLVFQHFQRCISSF